MFGRLLGRGVFTFIFFQTEQTGEPGGLRAGVRVTAPGRPENSEIRDVRSWASLLRPGVTGFPWTPRALRS